MLIKPLLIEINVYRSLIHESSNSSTSISEMQGGILFHYIIQKKILVISSLFSNQNIGSTPIKMALVALSERKITFPSTKYCSRSDRKMQYRSATSIDSVANKLLMQKLCKILCKNTADRSFVVPDLQ